MLRKDTYLDTMEGRLHDWDARAEQLRATADRDDDAIIDYYKQMAVLRPRREALQSLLQQLRNADDEEWQSSTGDVDAAWDDIQAALETATERVQISNASRAPAR